MHLRIITMYSYLLCGQREGATDPLYPEYSHNCASRADIVGIDSEGLYRVSGFHSDIEAIKLSLDKGKLVSSISAFYCLFL